MISSFCFKSKFRHVVAASFFFYLGYQYHLFSIQEQTCLHFICVIPPDWSSPTSNVQKTVGTFLTLHHSCPSGIPFMQVEAVDRDDLNTAHADLRFSLMEQTPRIPSSQMFSIHPITGEVSLTEEGQSQIVSGVIKVFNEIICLSPKRSFREMFKCRSHIVLSPYKGLFFVCGFSFNCCWTTHLVSISH